MEMFKSGLRQEGRGESTGAEGNDWRTCLKLCMGRGLDKGIVMMENNREACKWPLWNLGRWQNRGFLEGSQMSSENE